MHSPRKLSIWRAAAFYWGSKGKSQGTLERIFRARVSVYSIECEVVQVAQTLFGSRSVDDVFISNTANYKFCGMEIIPAFSSHDVMKAPDISRDIIRLRKHLTDHL